MAPPDKTTMKTRNNSKDEGDPLSLLGEKLEVLFKEMHDFRSEFKDMGVSINSTHEKVDELKTMFCQHRVDIDACLQDIDTLKSENTSLKNELNKLREEVCSQQQYSRRNTVDIQGVPETKQENIVEVVKRVAKVLRFELKTEMIDAVHRLPGDRRDSKPRGIILKFVRRLDCDDLLKLAKVKRGFFASELGLQSESKVYVNPSLCKMYRELLYLAKNAVRDGFIKFAWHSNGRILVRRREGQPAIHITTRDQLRRLTHRDSTCDTGDN